MGSSQQEIIKIALERAGQCVEGAMEDLIRETRGNHYTLTRAAHQLDVMAQSGNGSEFVALELIAAAYKRMTGRSISPG